ncbi:hypothetical protein VE04_03775 [Pseudogymnoascus sp. 24MN13]|nr:hypothetical protein VE04_03775 [Pseudogymnoascus sp. 24MN13]
MLKNIAPLAPAIIAITVAVDAGGGAEAPAEKYFRAFGLEPHKRGHVRGRDLVAEPRSWGAPVWPHVNELSAPWGFKWAQPPGSLEELVTPGSGLSLHGVDTPAGEKGKEPEEREEERRERQAGLAPAATVVPTRHPGQAYTEKDGSPSFFTRLPPSQTRRTGQTSQAVQLPQASLLVLLKSYWYDISHRKILALETQLPKDKSSFWFDEQKGLACSSHGGRCSCALKKAHSHPVLESDLDENSTSMVTTTEILPPSTLQASSDTSFLVSATSHHVTAPKHTEMAHPWALTYNVPRVDSTQCAAPSLLNDSIENLPYLSTADAFHGDFQIQNTAFNAQMEQMVVDPELGPLDLINPSNIEPLNSHPPPFDTSSFDSLPSNLDFPLNFDDLDTIHEIDQSLVPANCGSISIDWSHYDNKRSIPWLGTEPLVFKRACDEDRDGAKVLGPDFFIGANSQTLAWMDHARPADILISECSRKALNRENCGITIRQLHQEKPLEPSAINTTFGTPSRDHADITTISASFYSRVGGACWLWRITKAIFCVSC